MKIVGNNEACFLNKLGLDEGRQLWPPTIGGAPGLWGESGSIGSAR